MPYSLVPLINGITEKFVWEATISWGVVEASSLDCIYTFTNIFSLLDFLGGIPSGDDRLLGVHTLSLTPYSYTIVRNIITKILFVAFLKI